MNILINEKDYTKNLILPIKTQKTRDLSLWQGVLTLVYMTRKMPFAPFTAIFLNGEKWFVGKDVVTQTIFGKNPRFKHDITLIEQTKLLEKYFVDTCTFRNALTSKSQSIVTPNISTLYSSIGQPAFIEGAAADYKTPLLMGSQFTFKKFGDIFSNRIGGIPSTFDYNLARTTVYFNGEKEFDTGLIWNAPTQDKAYTTTLKQGKYLLTYYCGIGSVAGNEAVLNSKDEYLFTVSYEFNVQATLIEKKSNSLADVVNKLLLIAEIPRKGDNAVFRLNSQQLSELSLQEAPELSIANCTLREALNKVGGIIHAQCRLDGNVVYFDKFDETKMAKIIKQPVAYSGTQDMEQFCSELISNVKNLVPNNEDKSGQIVEPFAKGFKTTRTETGSVVITDNTAFIQTKYRVQQIVDVEMGYINDSATTDPIGSIKDYIVGKPVYDTMDSYSTSIPANSKSFNLYYEVGRTGIRGLNYVINENSLVPAERRMAINNIVNNKLGKDIDASKMPLAKLQFRVTYIPIVDTVVKQYKSFIGDIKTRAALAYNQSDFKISSQQYGENLKGVIARLGNVEKTITYVYKLDEEIPQVGELFDEDYRITAIKEEILQTYRKITLCLSKNYNRQNEFVGISNEQRFYEIAEKQSVERTVVYSDFLIIGDDLPIETDRNKRTLAQEGILFEITNRFKGQSGVYGGLYRKEITRALLNTFDQQGNKLTNDNLSLPVLSYPLGNSACYSFNFNNNYGADDCISGTVSDTKALQNEVRYTDAHGEFEYLSFDLLSYSYFTGDALNPTFIEPRNFDEAVEMGFNLPKEVVPSGTQKAPPVISTKDYYQGEGYGQDFPLDIRKDNAEIIGITYQINIVTNWENIVIGSGLAKTLGVGDWGNDLGTIKCYILPRKVRQFENKIFDELNDEITYSMSVHSFGREVRFGNVVANKNGQSLVFVNDVTKELMFAVNLEITNGETIILPKMMLRHKVFANIE